MSTPQLKLLVFGIYRSMREYEQQQKVNWPVPDGVLEQAGFPRNEWEDFWRS